MISVTGCCVCDVCDGSAVQVCEVLLWGGVDDDDCCAPPPLFFFSLRVVPKIAHTQQSTHKTTQIGSELLEKPSFGFVKFIQK